MTLRKSILNNNELKEMQSTGNWPVFDSDLLMTEYADRYIQAKGLFEKMNTQMFNDICNLVGEGARLTNWRDEDLPEKIYSYRHEGPVIGYDEDYMVGPHDWEHEDSPIGDYVVRKKCYLYDWTGEKIHAHMRKGGAFGFSELLYFINMHNDFKPILEQAHELYSDQPIKRFIHKLMVIEYSTPTATDDNRVEHRAHNTNRFGGEHCDETLAGLHLGENYMEFQARNTLTKCYQFIPGLDGSKMLWMFGEHAEASGWKPTYHRMVPNPDPYLDTRYSIIFDLQARYEE